MLSVFERTRGPYCLITSVVNVFDELFASSSYDQTVRILNVKEDYKCTKTLNYSENAIAKEVDALLYCE
jgi:hypothetical protein